MLPTSTRSRPTGPIGARSANTICDGIAVKRPGDFTLPLVERYVDEVVTVSDDEVAEAMVMLLERTKLVVEGAGAVAVAALMQGRVAPPAEGDVCAVLSGGNVDASLLSECIRLGETAAGRRMVLSTVVPDRPGALAGLLRVVAEHGGNVVDVEHLRDGIDLHVRETAIKLVLQTRGPDANEEILDAARAEGFSMKVERERPWPDRPCRSRRLGLLRPDRPCRSRRLGRLRPDRLSLGREAPGPAGAAQLVDLSQLVLAQVDVRRGCDPLDVAGAARPAIATCTPGCARTHATASWGSVYPRCSAKAPRCSTASRLRSRLSPANGSWSRRQSPSSIVEGSKFPLNSPCESGP